MFNRLLVSSSVVAMSLMQAAMGIEGAEVLRDTTPHHQRRGNGHKLSGFDGELIRQMNRTNGVGSPSLMRRAWFEHNVGN
jgi:hypothetical protein